MRVKTITKASMGINENASMKVSQYTFESTLYGVLALCMLKYEDVANL